jgi:hypothetical protein
MTLNDILVAALAQLDRGHDPQTLDTWRDKLTRFANDAQEDLCAFVRPRRSEMAQTQGNTLDVSTLERTCRKLVSLQKDGKPVRFSQGPATGRVCVSEDGPLEVTYVFEPRPLSSPSDVPELPPLCHAAIVTYVVARERLSGDVSTQAGGNLYMQMYQAQKARLRSHYGEPDAYKITNRW